MLHLSLATRRLIKIASLLLLLASFLPLRGEVLQLTDANFDSVLSAFPSSSSLVLFQSNDCRHCQQMEEEYIHLSNDELVREARVLVATVHGPSNRNLRLRFDVRSYPTMVYLKDGRMFAYRGQHKTQNMRSFVLKGYENQAEGEPIPPRITMWNRMGMMMRMAWGELGDAAKGELGTVGYVTVLLTGVVLGLVGMTVFVMFVLATRKLKVG